MALSTLALAGAGRARSRPPSTAIQTLCTRILPLVRSSEISTTPAPSEPERSVIERPSARPSGRARLPVAHLRDRLEALARLRRDRHALEAEVDRVHARVHRHLVDEALDREDVEHVPDRAPVLEADAVRHAAPLDVLVGDVVVGDADAGVQQHAAFADHAVPPAGDLAARVLRRLQALERLRAEHAVGDVLLARPDQLHRAAAPPWRCARTRPRSRRASAGRSRRPCSTGASSTCSGLRPSALATSSRDGVGRLAAFPHLDLVAGRVDAHHRVQRLHLRVIAVVAAELGLVGLGRAGEGRLRRRPSCRASGDLRVRIVVDLDVVVERLLGIEARGRALASTCTLSASRAAIACSKLLGDDRDAVRAAARCAITPGIVLISASFQLSGAPVCTGECSAVA